MLFSEDSNAHCDIGLKISRVYLEQVSAYIVNISSENK